MSDELGAEADRERPTGAVEEGGGRRATVSAYFGTDRGPDAPVVVFHQQRSPGDAAVRHAIARGMGHAAEIAEPVPTDPSRAGLAMWWSKALATWDEPGSGELRLIAGRTANHAVALLDRPVVSLSIARDPVQRLLEGPSSITRSVRGSALPDVYARLAGGEPSDSIRHAAAAELFNGQARALLAPHYDTAGLPFVGDDDPEAQTWRRRLRELVDERYVVAPGERIADLVRLLGALGGWERVPKVDRSPSPAAAMDPAERDIVARYNWLDADLHAWARDGFDAHATRARAGAPTADRAPRLVARDEMVLVFETRRRNLVTVDQPLILISQAQRSGGSLLNQLFDGHPSVHGHPHELKPGGKPSDQWPVIELNAGPKRWWRELVEAQADRMLREGYRKDARKHVQYEGEIGDSHPFLFAPSFQQRLFFALVEESPPRSPREVLDRYMTSYFNAWLDYQSLHGRPKRWVVAFRPRMGWGESRRRFLADYADGQLVSSVRDPKAWYASAARFAPGRFASVDDALDLWRHGARELIAAAGEAPDRVHVVRFEDVVGQTEGTMRALCERLDIAFHPTLVEPTFNGILTRANSSFRVASTGVLPGVLDTWRDSVSDADQARIDETCGELHAEAAALALSPRTIGG